MSPRKRSFSRANRWQNIAPSLQLRPRLFPSLSMKHARSRAPSKKMRSAQPAISPSPLRAAAASIAGSPADCPAGSWPMPALKPRHLPQQPVKEPKHEEATAEAEADAIAGGAEFDEEETEEQTEEGTEEAEETPSTEVTELSEEEAEEVEAGRAANRAEFAADVAQEHAEHDATHGEHEHGEHEHAEIGHVEEEAISAAPGEPVAEGAAAIEEDVILLPGETRAPRVGGLAAPREDFPRDSARIGGNPRSRFQRPFRSGGRDRGRDSRGGRPDSRGGRPDSRGARPDRGGRPGSSGGPRFERRPSGGPRHDRGYQGGRSGPSRRPQLISEMLKAGQDVVIQIAKEPLGKKGARITSHVALPGRFLVYMPTVHHTGVSRKI